MQGSDRQDRHERFKELCALAHADALSIGERLELEEHLRICKPCREVYEAYALVSEAGMAFLAAPGELPREARNWDDRDSWEKLSSAIQNQRSPRVLPFQTALPRQRPAGLRVTPVMGWIAGLVAACMIAVIAFGAYHAGARKNLAPQKLFSKNLAPVKTPTGDSASQPKAAPTDQSSVRRLAAQTAQISSLEAWVANEQKELTRLRGASDLAQVRLAQLGKAADARQAELRQRTEERDKLASQLGETEKQYQNLQVELTNLRNEHSQTLLQTASLESKLGDLTSANQDQSRRLNDDEQYLVSDRDIRELMGARKLYIADVFDVDSGSRTRKPFGRVFYTQDKSLIFYAFDLDHQPGVRNASAFQVWGQRDSESNGESHPMNLGILYMDSETNRRWVLRLDDPRQLAEIDAVFVTVEPHGGSQKPTGKPFLYALLRKEANHP
jgi:anti-sigma-K factor RskA